MRTDRASISMPGGRPVNEDSILLVQDGRDQLCVLCDGLGGHLFGEEASACVCSEMGRCFLSGTESEPGKRLKSCIERSQEALLSAQKTDVRHSSMRTTLCALLISEDLAYAAYIGDSRIYWFRDGKMRARTLDHSVPQMMVQLGELSEDQIRGNENRNRLLRAMGMPWEEPLYEIWSPGEKLQNGDAFLLCSDGFWEWILESEMEAELGRTHTAAEWVCGMERKVRQAGRKQEMDNYSAIAVRIV